MRTRRQSMTSLDQSTTDEEDQQLHEVDGRAITAVTLHEALMQ